MAICRSTKLLINTFDLETYWEVKQTETVRQIKAKDQNSRKTPNLVL